MASQARKPIRTEPKRPLGPRQILILIFIAVVSHVMGTLILENREAICLATTNATQGLFCRISLITDMVVDGMNTLSSLSEFYSKATPQLVQF